MQQKCHQITTEVHDTHLEEQIVTAKLLVLETLFSHTRAEGIQTNAAVEMLSGIYEICCKMQLLAEISDTELTNVVTNNGISSIHGQLLRSRYLELGRELSSCIPPAIS